MALGPEPVVLIGGTLSRLPDLIQAKSGVSTMRTNSMPYNYRCPNVTCKAEYIAIGGDRAPQTKPSCIDCGTAFLAQDKGLYIYYEAAWPVTMVPPDNPPPL